MKKLATALALVAMTAGGLVALEGASFASGRHGKRPVIQRTVTRKKVKKSHKGFEDGALFVRRVNGRKRIRRHRKTVKTPVNPGMGPISQISMSG